MGWAIFWATVSPTHLVTLFQNYNTYLRRLLLSKREDAEEDKESIL
jgi:hypothetical protein